MTSIRIRNPDAYEVQGNMRRELRWTGTLLGLGILAFTLVVFSYSQGSPQRSLAETLAKETAARQPLDPKRFAVADNLFKERRDFAKARTAYETFHDLFAKNPNDWE